MSKKKNTLLVVDAEPQTRKMLDIVLDTANFTVEECLTGKEATRLSVSLKPDLILLDLNLPDMNGNDVITSVRSWSSVPIIVLTARSTSQDAVTALNLGADDYVTKPFNMSVLEARINANLRQSAIREVGEPDLTNGPLRMDLVRHQVYMDDKLVAFTPKEYDLLRYFMVHCGKMLTHKELLKEVWGNAHGEDTQYLRVFIGQIREKIEVTASIPLMITTEQGIGYRMEFMGPSKLRRQGGGQA
ncbi:MAG: response regulator transcription factor [Alphaproteobacteria bacterium]